MRRRREWFDHIDTYMELWWVPAGHQPDVAEGAEKLELLERFGPTSETFTFRQPFPAPHGCQAWPVTDRCA